MTHNPLQQTMQQILFLLPIAALHQQPRPIFFSAQEEKNIDKHLKQQQNFSAREFQSQQKYMTSKCDKQLKMPKWN